LAFIDFWHFLSLFLVCVLAWWRGKSGRVLGSIT
jgi:hypothetical protein